MSKSDYKVIVCKDTCATNALGAIVKEGNKLISEGYKILGTPSIAIDNKSTYYGKYVAMVSVVKTESKFKKYELVIGTYSSMTGATSLMEKEVNEKIGQGYEPIGSVTTICDPERMESNRYSCIQAIQK